MLKPLSERPRQRQHQRGISLVELMVGLLVSLVVLWGISVVYLNTSATGKTAQAVTQLNQDLRAMMDIMVADIRRAGTWNPPPDPSNPNDPPSGPNPFTAPGADLVIIATDPSTPLIGPCILYSYDATFVGGTGGTVDAGDIFGFRVSNGVLQTLEPGSLTTTANAATDCANDANWVNLSDNRTTTLTMAVNTTGSQCIAFDPKTYVATDTTTYKTWKTTGGLAGACLSTAPGAISPYPAATNTFVETRQVNISLTATSTTDATLTRTLDDSALVRNNRVIAP